MKKYVFAVLAAIAALVVSLGGLTSSAQAYPDVRIDLGVNHPVVYGGEAFKATGTSNVGCSWKLDWNDVVRQGSGAKYVASYTAPTVNRITKIPLSGVCTYADPAASARTVATADTWDRTITVTVLPRASAASPASAGADLPGTGGPNLVVLLSGLGLLLAGATAVRVARRRADEVELPGQTA